MKYSGYVAVLLVAIVCHGATPPGENPVGPLLIDEVPPRFAEAELVAIEWTKYFIAARYRPPEVVRYVALPRSGESTCDLVRLRYTTGRLLVTITQSLGMFCVQVKNVRGELKAETLADVQEIAKSLFDNGSTIRLAKPSSAQEPGTADAEASPDLRWIKSLRWKVVDDGVVFWIFKSEGTTPMASVGMTILANEYWYSPRPDPPNRPRSN